MVSGRGRKLRICEEGYIVEFYQRFGTQPREDADIGMVQKELVKKVVKPVVLEGLLSLQCSKGC